MQRQQAGGSLVADAGQGRGAVHEPGVHAREAPADGVHCALARRATSDGHRCKVARVQRRFSCRVNLRSEPRKMPAAAFLRFRVATLASPSSQFFLINPYEDSVAPIFGTMWACL